MEEIDILNESKRCLSCPKPLCQTGCPTENLIKEWIFAVKNGDFFDAREKLYSVNPFPELTSLLCDYDRQCKGKCIRGLKGEPINIPVIENYLANKFHRDLTKKENNGFKIAIVGSGPAGLSAAYFFLKDGYDVTVFEKENRIGGAILTGIPDFRFDKSPLDLIKKDLEDLGCRFVFNFEVGKSTSLDELKNKYDYVVLAIGAEKENTAGLKAAAGFVGGLSILYDLNVLNKKEEIKNKYSKVLVWGGGNVALDCARSLKRIINNTSIIYRRSEAEMPANKREIVEARDENIDFLFLENIEELILNTEGKVVGVKTIKMKLGDLDSSGRRSFIKIEGSESEIECDLVVAALGEKPIFDNFSRILTDWDKQETNFSNVFICGDCCTGPKNIASAITQGRNVFKLITSKRG